MLALDTAQERTPAFDSKRLHLLKVAARVFAEVGYDGASMRRIAAESELSLSGIYHYVSSKEELLYWIQYHTFDSLLRSLSASLEGVVGPRERLAAAVRNHVRHFGENMHELQVCARELGTLEGEAYDAVHERRLSYFEAVHGLVRELHPKKATRLNSWIATANLFGMINWFYQWYDAGRSRVSLDDLAAEQITLFLDGYGPRGNQ
ncbi:MAG: TetR family transcriptional regulator [Longimicrobiales bacterium]